MSFFSNRKKLSYFITRNFKEEISEKSNLILSPEFYWCKKVTLNLRYTYEASKMAVSIFDGILPNGNFKYKVFKIAKKEFVFIAYDIESILQEIEKIGINIQMIDKIYTFQSEFMGKDIALKVDENYAIVSNEGVMTYMPLKFLGSMADLYVSDVLQDRKLSSNYVYSKNLQKTTINSKQLNQIISMLAVLVLILLLNLIRLEKNRNLFDAKKSNLIQKYELPATSFQVKSMQDELLEVDRQQSILRDIVEYIGSFKLLKGEYFNSLSYEKSVLKVDINLKNSARKKQFKIYISKKYKVFKVSKSRRGYKMEISL